MMIQTPAPAPALSNTLTSEPQGDNIEQMSHAVRELPPLALSPDKLRLLREIAGVRRKMLFLVYVSGDGSIRFIVQQPSEFEIIK